MLFHVLKRSLSQFFPLLSILGPVNYCWSPECINVIISINSHHFFLLFVLLDTCHRHTMHRGQMALHVLTTVKGLEKCEQTQEQVAQAQNIYDHNIVFTWAWNKTVYFLDIAGEERSEISLGYDLNH